MVVYLSGSLPTPTEISQVEKEFLDELHSKILLKDLHQGFLDIELLYQLKRKEEVRRVEQEIEDRIENPLEEETPLFQRAYEKCRPTLPFRKP